MGAHLSNDNPLPTPRISASLDVERAVRLHLLRLFRTEREEHVAWTQAERSVPGTDIHHASGDHRRRAVHRSTLRLHAVDGAELAVRVEGPDNRAVCR